MRPRKTLRKVVPPPPDVDALIKRLDAASDSEIVDILRPLQIWCFPRGDMHSWVPITKKFIAILERMRDSYGLGRGSKTSCKLQLNDFTPKDKELIIAVLGFIRLLMENSTSRKLFDGYDVVNDLLLTTDLDVLEGALYVLLRPLQQYLTKMPTSSELSASIRARLLALTRGWDRFHMADCNLVKYASSPDPIELPEAAATLQLQFYPPIDPAAPVEPLPAPPKSAPIANPLETPTRPTMSTARSEQRLAVTPAAKAVAPTVDSSMVTVDLGNIAKTMGEGYLDRLAQITEEHPMEVEDQLIALNKTRLILQTTDVGVRRKLLSNRLLALACYITFSDEDAVQSNVFLCEPELVNEVSELLVPDRKVSEDVVASAILALDAAAHHRSEVLTSINAHVSHGIIMSLLRSIVAKLVANEPVAHDTVDALLGFLAYINSLPLHGNLLIGAGLIPALIEMLDIKGDRRGQYIPRASGLIDSAYFTHPQALQALTNADGLNALVLRIKAEVHMITDAPLPDDTELFNRDSIIAYNTNPLKAELRSIYRMLQSTGGSDGFRNVVDTDLPKSLKSIITNADKFGLRNFGLAINIMSTIVHNEPTSLGILQEAHLPQTLYEVLEKNMPDAFEVVYTLPNAIGAICLNPPGLADTIKHFGVISNIIKATTSWNSDEFADRDYVTTIGQSLDELVRHHPTLRPKVREAVVSLLNEAIEEGKAFKPTAKEVHDYAVDPNDVAPEMDVDSTDEAKAAEHQDKDREPITKAPLAKLTNILKLLSVLLRNSNMCKEFISEGGLDIVISVAQLPCIPVRFSSTEMAVAMPSVMRAIGEHDQVQLTERLVSRVKDDLAEIPELWKDGPDCHQGWLTMTKTDGSEADYRRLRRVAALALLFSSLSDYLSITLSSQRTATQLIKTLGVTSGSSFMPDLGLLHRQCFVEHVLFKDIGAADAAEHAAKEAKEKPEASADEPASTSGAESCTAAPTDVATDVAETAPAPAATPVEFPAYDKRPPTRVQTVKMIVTRMHAILTRFFKSTIRLIFNKRVPEPAHKTEAAALANCVAQILIGHLQVSAQFPAKQYAIDTVALGLTTILLFDERGAEGHLSTTLFIPFDQQGGMAVMLDNIHRLVYGMEKYPTTPVEEQTQEQKDEVTQLVQGIRIATSVLSAYASPRALVDSPQTHIIQQREMSLPTNQRFSVINTFVRIRRDILPITQKVWMAEWLSRLPLHIMRTAISTFFEIMAAKHEEMEVTIAMPEPASPSIRDIIQPRPLPTANPAAVQQLVEMGFGRRPAERALIRARNNVASAADALISMPHLFPDDGPAEPAAAEAPPAVEDPEAPASAPAAEGAAPVAENAEVTPAPGAADAQPEASTSTNPDATDKIEGDMEVDQAPSPTTVWESQREELNKLREGAKKDIPARAVQLLDSNEELVHSLLPALPAGVDGITVIIDRLEEAAKESPLRPGALASRLRVLAVFARAKGPIELPVEESQRALSVLMTGLPATETPRPSWLAAYFVAAESVMLMSTTITDAKLGEDSKSDIVRQVNLNSMYSFIIGLIEATLAADELSREELMGCMRLAVIITRQRDDWASPKLLDLAMKHFKNPKSKVAGSYPYLAMLTRHAFDTKASLLDVMRREISEWMTPQRNKVTDVQHFVRQLRQMAYRDANTFIDAVQEEAALVDPGPASSVYHIRAKEDSKDKVDGEDKDAKDKDAKKTLVAAANDPFVKSNLDSFENHTAMDYLVSQLSATIQTIHQEETAKRSGTEYTEAVGQAYTYMGLLLALLVELTGSYMSAKTSFMAALRQGSVYGVAGKGKSGFTTLLSDLVCCVTLADVQERNSKVPDAPEVRRVTLSSWATSLLVALCANVSPTSDNKELPEDLVTVRRVVLEGIAKVLKESTAAHFDANSRYGRLWSVGQLIRRLLTSRPSVVPRPTDKTSLQLAKGMLEKNFVGLMTSTVSEIDLNYPDIRNVLVSLLKALEHLTKISNKWGKTDYKPTEDGKEDEDEEDTDNSDDDEEEHDDMSMSEEEDGPDLYRNSALGILGGDIDVDDEDDEMDGSDMDEDDELMEAFDDEMDHDMDDDEADTEPSDDEDDDDDDDLDDLDGHGSEMEGDWTTDEEEGGELIDDADPVIDVGAGLEEVDDDDEAGVPWDDDDGLMDGEDGEGFDSDEDGFTHEPFGGVDFDPEEEALEDFDDEEGYDELDMDPMAAGHPAGGPNLGDGGGHWGWQEPARPPDGSGRSRSLLDMDSAASSLFGLQRTTHADHSQHPLLANARPQPTIRPNNPFGPLSSLTELLASIESLGGLQAVQFVENILQRNRNHGAERIRVDLAHRQDGSFGLMIGGRSFTVQPPTRQLPNTAEEIQGEFDPRPTMQRWQEEQNLFPYSSAEQIARIVIHVINRLLPAAREASAKEAERLRKQEEEDAEKRRKEEIEAAAEAEKQREEEMAAAASVALPESRPETSQGAVDDDVDMASDDEDGDSESDEGEGEGDAEIVQEDSNRVTISIHGEEIDITDTGIDLEFLQALPEDMRAEVVEHHLREQSLLMRPTATNVPESSHIHSDFLDALPPEIRAEVMMQESLEQARRAAPPAEPRVAEPQASGSGAILPGTLRDLETEIRGMLRGDDLRDMLARTIGLPPALSRKPPVKKKSGPTTTERRPLQLLDKPGIASLVRLLFFPAALREGYLFRTLVNLCENDETRSDLLNLLLSIVQDGTGDLPAVDRSFQQMSLRGLTTTPKAHATPSGKVVETPGPVTASLFSHLQSDHIPTFIAQRCFEALSYIVNSNRQAVSYFLTEHELPVGLKKHSKKGKGKEKFLPQKQFPIVVLMSLLDRTELLKAPGMMESLTGLLAAVTKPLTALQNWRQRVDKELAKADKTEERTGAEQAAAASGSGSTETGVVVAPAPVDLEAFKGEWKIERPMFPPAVLRLVVNGLTIGDCTSKTFTQTIMVLQNLSSIPEAKQVLVQELCTRSQQLGTVILGELDKLSKALEDKGHELSSLDLVDFAPAGSSQAQLLRLLKTIDYLHSRKSNSTAKPDELTEDEKAAHDLYLSFDFSQLWSELSDCLTEAEARGSTEQIAAVLLPLVEALMVVCKYTRPPGQTNFAEIVSPMLSPTSPTPSSTDLFLSFTNTHRKVLNSIVRNNPALMSGSFSLLVANPRVLEFDNKRNWFFQKLKRKRDQVAYPTLHLNVRRQYVFQDSFSALLHRPGDEVKYGKINIKFINEDGVDAGGVTREWYHVLAQQIFDPDYALFEPCAADNQTYQPNKHSSVNPDHLSYFKFVGRVIGKAIFDGRLLDAYFNRAFYKQILGRNCDIRDLEAIDPEYHKSLQWMLDNDITDVIDQEFTIEDDSFGAKQIVELKPGGASIPVTEGNKDEYVRLVCAYRLENSIKEQMNAFLSGFYEIIPRQIIQIFEPDQLELLISGLSTFDVDELKNSTQMSGWKSSDVEIAWFWRALRSFSQEERSRFLIFVTASSRVPLGGFEKLQGSSGTQPFQIQRLYGKEGILPQASTCFNLLLLPKYESYEQLRERLLFAVTETEGFGKA